MTVTMAWWFIILLFVTVFMSLRQLLLLLKYHAMITNMQNIQWDGSLKQSFWWHMVTTAALITATVVLW